MKRRNNLLLFLVSLACLSSIAAVRVRAAEQPVRPEFKVSGLGWQDNRLARDTLKALLGNKPHPTLDANAIEDAALILFSEQTDAGYLKAAIVVEATLTDGRTVSYPLDARLENPLPRPLEATAVTLKVERGRRFVLKEITFTGLSVLDEEKARGFFVGESLLIALASDRVYSPSRLARSAANLQAELVQHGYAEADVITDQLVVNEETGDTSVRVVVQEGPRWRIKSVVLDVKDSDVSPPELDATKAGHPWSSHWRQNALTALRSWYYEHGYPDVQVRITPFADPPVDGQRAVTVTTTIYPGPQVRVGKILFEGNEHTREDALRPLVPAHPGDLLDPSRFDDGLSRLSRLGVFSHIALDYEPPGGDVRDATYRLTEGRRQELSLLAGYGSYEQLRGGIEWRHYNLFGRAHSDDLQLIQSMKSSQGSYTYTVPELFGTTVDGSARLFGLQREELAFERQEYGASVSLLWPLKPWGASLTTGYTYQNLNSSDNELATRNLDETETKAASIDLGLIKDKRDSPLQPHRGYKVALRVEAAAKALGGEVDYQQIIFTSSWHTSWGRGRWIHLGLAQGVVTTLGAPDGSNPPVNVLFYPGGDGSIRGYQKDEAAPRNPVTGEYVGAKTYTQLNVELEQALTRKWSAVAFFDAVGTAARLEDYPFSEKLYSVGLGVRYNTVIGPVRLEYGHNLNPRPLDPSGTLLFSIGYPF
jgi:outer membrane protein assembly complex protein YaeT